MAGKFRLVKLIPKELLVVQSIVSIQFRNYPLAERTLI